MSTQLAAFGLCIAFGHPLAFVLVVLAEVGLAAALVLRRESFVNVEGEVVLEHR